MAYSPMSDASAPRFTPNWLSVPALWVSLLCLITLLISCGKQVQYAASDPALSLLTSQALIEHQSLKLDPYTENLILEKPLDHHLNVGAAIQHNGYIYDYFPAGPAIFTTPIVAAARIINLTDMASPVDNYPIQDVLAALTSMMALILLYKLGRCYVEWPAAALIAAISVWGSSLISTMGSALWNLNYEVLIISIVLWLVIRREHGKAHRREAILCGFALFLAFSMRASAASLIIPTILFLLWRDRQYGIRAATAAALGLLLFMGWSWYVYQLWLPPYYSLGRLQSAPVPGWIAIYGNLLSPSRGIFVFSPFLIMPVIGYSLRRRYWKQHPLGLLILMWLVLHLILLSQAVIWWGGGSYGPRLMGDILPGLSVLTALVWSTFPTASLQKRWVISIIGLYLLLGAVGIYINSWQGLYNLHTGRWNEYIEPVPLPPLSGLGELFEWRYAQFLSTGEMICEIEEERTLTLLPDVNTLTRYKLGRIVSNTADQSLDWRAEIAQHLQMQPSTANIPATQITGTSYQTFLPLIQVIGNQALFVGFEPPPASPRSFRWTTCPTTHLVLRWEVVKPPDTVALIFTSGSWAESQRVLFSINGIEIGEHLFTAPIAEPEQILIPFSGEVIRPGALNTITMEMPDASSPQSKQIGRDPRLLALSFQSMQIIPFTAGLQPLPPRPQAPSSYPSP